ncbi:MAG: glycosyltransferase family 2 protein [Gaiellaceae bacterium]
MSAEAMPVSVVIPTVGRVAPLTACLESLSACRPSAAEILVVDQSHDPAVRQLVEQFADAGARLVSCPGRGVSRGRNLGFARSAHEVVLVTDDDCTVATGWVGTAWRLMAGDTRRIFTGQVVPVGDPKAVPSFKVDPAPYDYTGRVHGGALFPNNMVANRDMILEAGGFDERFRPSEAAEDNDFCYRWLKSGHRLNYEPALVVWHHDWRTPAELDRLYVSYARGQGFLYAKHLRQGDLRMLVYLARDVYYGLRGFAAALVKRRKSWTDPRRGIRRGLPGGLWYGCQVFFLNSRGESSQQVPTAGGSSTP